jgi:hypothetical protein
MLVHEKRALPVFSVAVSLGGDCVPIHHIKAHNIPYINGPFDHTLTPIVGLCSILQDDFRGYLDPAILHEVATDGPLRYIFDRRYGCMFLYDFKGTAPLDCPEVQAKFAHKIDNFRRALASEEPVLFVRRNCGRGDAEKLTYLINRLHPKLQWHLLVMNNAHEPDWGLALAHNRHMDAAIAFPGDPTAWAWALSQFTFKSQLT